MDHALDGFFHSMPLPSRYAESVRTPAGEDNGGVWNLRVNVSGCRALRLRRGGDDGLGTFSVWIRV